MATLPNVQVGNTDLSSILGLLGNGSLMDTLFGQSGSGTSTGTSSGTTSQTTKIDQLGLNSMLADLLGSSQGLASLLGGQRSAGLYNSSTNRLLASDFITRMAGQVAQRNSTTTGSTSGNTSGATTNTKNNQVDPMQAMLAAILKSLASQKSGGGGQSKAMQGGNPPGSKKPPKSQSDSGAETPVDNSTPSNLGEALSGLEQYMGVEAGSFDPTMTGGDNYGYDEGAGMEYAGLDYNWGWEGAAGADSWYEDNGFGGTDYNYIDNDAIDMGSGYDLGGGSDSGSYGDSYDYSSDVPNYIDESSSIPGGGDYDWGQYDFGDYTGDY